MDVDTPRPHFILASSSPRRRALLQQIGLEPDAIIPANLDEAPLTKELPRQYVMRMALAKASHVASITPKPALVLGCDTIAAIGRRILRAPCDRDEAHRYLTMLSGRRHTVYSAVALIGSAGWPQEHCTSRLVATAVGFSRLSEKQIEALLDQGDWQGKAGGYALQGAASAHIRFVGGSPSGVIGLPLFETAQLLRGQKGSPFLP